MPWLNVLGDNVRFSPGSAHNHHYSVIGYAHLNLDRFPSRLSSLLIVMAYNDSSASGTGNYDGFPFPPTPNAQFGQSSTSKSDAPSGSFWSPGGPGFPLESPSTMPWYFSATSPFNFNQAFAMSDAADASSSSSTGQQQSYFPPFHSHQPSTQSSFQQPHPPPPSQFQHPSYHKPETLHPSSFPPGGHGQHGQQYQQPHPTQQPVHQHSTYSPAHLGPPPPPAFLGPPAHPVQRAAPASHPSAFLLPSGDRRQSAVASSVPPALIRDNSSSRSSYSSVSSAGSSRPGPAHLLPLCVDMSLVDGTGAVGQTKTLPTEIKIAGGDDLFQPIHVHPFDPSSSRRSSRNPVLSQERMDADVDAEGDDDEEEDASEGESNASSSSSYHDGRQASSTAKRKFKQPLAPSASAKSSPTTASAKRRASAPSHLQRSKGSTTPNVMSPPRSPLKRVRLSPVVARLDDELCLPPLPADFDSYGPGGSSRFTDDGSGGGVAIPDFSGREDCWGIGKEAYQQLSAKAKKQLRNKLGARRFRERRKEYITTLEERIAGRDDIITTTRDRLRNSLQLVKELQAKVAALEQASVA